MKWIRLALFLSVAASACGRDDQPRRLKPPPSASSSGRVTIHAPDRLTSIEVGPRDPLGRPVRVACATCHSLKDEAAMPTSPADLRGFHVGLQFRHGNLACASCHEVAPRTTPALHLADGAVIRLEQTMQLCAQCHGAKHRSYQNFAHGGMSGAWDLRRGDRTRNHCVDCHDPHVPAVQPVSPVLPPRDRLLGGGYGNPSLGAKHD